MTELAWILSTVAPMGLLERAHSYKDKIARGVAPSAGLFTYPVLMAADILIYDSDIVPVGKDQKQHIEITRDLAASRSTRHSVGPAGQILKLPEPRIQAATEVVPGIDGQKMSKSYGNTIDIFGDEKETRKRVMSIVTDSTPVEAPKDPNKIDNFSAILAVGFEGGDWRRCASDFEKGGHRLWRFQKTAVRKTVGDISLRCGNGGRNFWPNKSYIDKILARGAERANEVADTVMKRVRLAVGL